MMKNKSKFDLKPPTTASTFHKVSPTILMQLIQNLDTKAEKTLSVAWKWTETLIPWWRFCKRWTHSMVEFLEFWHQMPSTAGAKESDLRKWKILHPALRCFCIQLRDVFAFEMAPEWNRIYDAYSSCPFLHLKQYKGRISLWIIYHSQRWTYEIVKSTILGVNAEIFTNCLNVERNTYFENNVLVFSLF